MTDAETTSGQTGLPAETGPSDGAEHVALTDPTSGESVAPSTIGEPLVVLTDVDKYFGELHVLQKINLSVRKGEVVVVLGPSGSGKSTLCRAINRREPSRSGSITIDGTELPEEGKALAHLRADVGMVFQSFNLFAHKTILENVMLAPVKVRTADKAAAEKDGMT